MNEDDWDGPVSLSEFKLTDKGKASLFTILQEFCHGFTIEEITANSATFDDVDEVKMMVLLVAHKAGIVPDQSFG